MMLYVVIGSGENWFGKKLKSVNAIFDSEEKANEYCEQQRNFWDSVTKGSILPPWKEAEWHIEKHILNKVEA